MCGRYGRRGDKQRISEWMQTHNTNVFDEVDDTYMAPSYNVAPQSFQPVVRLSPETGERKLTVMRWGLVPFWSKDGKAAFVEKQTARNDGEHTYSYSFVSSPLPVTNYASTIKVTAKGEGTSVVTWTSTYTPDSGKEKDASEALNGVYEAGLTAIKARFAK